MSQRSSSAISSASSYVRYFSVLTLAAFIGWRVLAMLTADMVEWYASLPAQARELSRVEMVLHAHQTPYVQLATAPAPLPAHNEEPEAIATALASQIDVAESSDPTHALSLPVKVQILVAPPSDLVAKTAKTTNQKKALALALNTAKARSSEPEFAPTTAFSLFGSFDATAKAQAGVKPEPARKKLARNNPTVGELIRMQLLSQI